MQTATQMAPVSNKKLWAGRIISAIPVGLLLFSGVMKLMMPPSVVEGFTHFGLPLNLAVLIAILEIGSAIVYAIPRTAVLGAILMTGYLGGATLTNVRVGDPSYVMTVLLGVLVWLGLYLRDARLRELLPLRR